MERLSHAQQSRDLGDPPEGWGDVDWLRASGAVAQQHGAALALWRLVELGDLRALAGAYAGALAVAERLQVVQPELVVSGVLAYLADPSCKACHGRGARVVPNTPLLEKDPCTHCEGSGHRPPRWTPDQAQLHERLLDLQRQAAAAVLRKMS